MRELEITVRVNSSYAKLHEDLTRIGFRKVKEYPMFDTYMIDKNIDISNMKDLDILSKTILVREVQDYKALMYKVKEYDENENIISQSKIDCKVDNVDSAIKFMKTINYDELFKINSQLIFYINDELEIVVQLVNDKYIFIEMEDSSGKGFNSIEEMIDAFSKLDIDYDRSNYFAKKAQIILNETRR